MIDGTRACELTDYKEALYVVGLGAAYAEARDFESAIKRAMDLSPGLASNKPTDDVRAQEAVPYDLEMNDYFDGRCQIISRPRIVPVLEANLSTSRPRRWSMET